MGNAWPGAAVGHASFNEPLVHLTMAAADFLLVPSRWGGWSRDSDDDGHVMVVMAMMVVMVMAMMMMHTLRLVPLCRAAPQA